VAHDRRVERELHVVLGEEEMMSRCRGFGLAVFAAVSLLGIRASSASTRSYNLTDLGALLPGSEQSGALGVNNAGQTVGSGDGGAISGAVLWSGGTAVALGNLQGISGNAAWAINNAGQAVGEAIGNGSTYAIEWTGGEPQILPGLAFPPGSIAYGINNSGQIVGSARLPGGEETNAMLWSGGSIINLGALGNGASVAQGINDAGQVVGSSQIPDSASGVTHAFLWNDGTMTDLGVLNGAFWSGAEAINDADQIVGWSNLEGYLSVGPQYATEWSGGHIIDLGMGNAYGINNLGQVVGTNNNRATLWSDGSAIDLTTDIAFGGSGWTLQTATGISDRGQIVGYGLNPLGVSTAFLLTPVPEPSTWAMMLLGFAGLGFVGRRRRRVLVRA
jgi:probable HAF family extracellular repeat protein